jgi:hypothetical protein
MAHLIEDFGETLCTIYLECAYRVAKSYNGLATTAGYDLDYRLTSLTLKNGAANVSSLAYAYGDGMNLSGITDTVTPARGRQHQQ